MKRRRKKSLGQQANVQPNFFPRGLFVATYFSFQLLFFFFLYDIYSPSDLFLERENGNKNLYFLWRLAGCVCIVANSHRSMYSSGYVVIKFSGDRSSSATLSQKSQLFFPPPPPRLMYVCIYVSERAEYNKINYTSRFLFLFERLAGLCTASFYCCYTVLYQAKHTHTFPTAGRLFFFFTR